MENNTDPRDKIYLRREKQRRMVDDIPEGDDVLYVIGAIFSMLGAFIVSFIYAVKYLCV